MISFKEFTQIAKDHNVIPLHETLSADLDTAVSAFMKIRSGKYDFLFESVEGGEKWARYSFLGTEPQKIYQLNDGEFKIIKPDGKSIVVPFDNNPLEVLREEFFQFKPYQDPDLPRFFGGAVGYFGYDMVQYFDGIELKNPKESSVPDFIFLLTDSVIIFDNLYQIVKVVNSISIPQSCQTDEAALKNLYDAALAKIQNITEKLSSDLSDFKKSETVSDYKEEQLVSQDQFCKMVECAREYIAAGDVFQVVLSMPFELKARGIDSMQIYRSIRRINPSPYMFYLQLDEFAIVGASPEVMVRLEDDVVEVRPIAGTRKRGDTDARDQELEQELINDPKEQAEHIMLVDLGRNDIGRVAQTGSINVDEQDVIERYSHVMHMVSHVSGKKAEDKNVFDVIASTFPAGTLSGAPKIRAMEIIEELEEVSRGVYGGAIGYISFTGNTDLAITIRTAVVHEDRVRVQAGAGIVYNSVPELEYKECCHKAKAMIEAVKRSIAI